MGPVLPGCSSTLQKTPDHLPQIGAWCDLVVTRPMPESHIIRRLSIGADHRAIVQSVLLLSAQRRPQARRLHLQRHKLSGNLTIDTQTSADVRPPKT